MHERRMEDGADSTRLQCCNCCVIYCKPCAPQLLIMHNSMRLAQGVQTYHCTWVASKRLCFMQDSVLRLYGCGDVEMNIVFGYMYVHYF